MPKKSSANKKLVNLKFSQAESKFQASKSDAKSTRTTEEKALENLTGKQQKVVYRDKKGRITSEKEALKGKKLTTWEIWRYSENTRKWKHINFGNKWKPQFRKRKRAISKKQLMLAAIKRYGAHKLEVKMINGEVYAYTASP